MKSIFSAMTLMAATALAPASASADVIPADLDLSAIHTQQLMHSLSVNNGLAEDNLQLAGHCYRGHRGHRGYRRGYYAPRPVYRSYYRGGYGPGYGYGRGYYGGYPGRGYGSGFGLYIGF